MADVNVPTSWYWHAWLPSICARHGGPATRPVKRTFYTRTPWWVYLLIVVSLLLAAIVSLAVRKSAAGMLPSCDRCVAERRRFIGCVVGGWLLGLVLLVLGAAADNGFVLLLGLLVWVVSLVITFCRDQFRVRGSVDRDLTWVRLKGVAPAFAAEVARGLASSGVPGPGYPYAGTVGAPVAPGAPVLSQNILPG